VFGDQLKYKLSVKDLYSDMLPVSCKYENTYNVEQNVPFVSDGCPIKFREEKDGYFGRMVRVEKGKYELDFKAFSFDYSKDSFLSISCVLLLCLEHNTGLCRKSCWNPTAPLESPPEETGNQQVGDPSAELVREDPSAPLGGRNVTAVMAEVKLDFVHGETVNGNPDSKDSFLSHKTILRVLKESSTAPSSSRPSHNVQLLTTLYCVIGALAIQYCYFSSS